MSVHVYRSTHLSIQNGVKLFKRPFPASIVNDGDQGQDGVRFEDGSAAHGGDDEGGDDDGDDDGVGMLSTAHVTEI